MAKASAVRVIQSVHAPVPTHDGTLYVEGLPRVPGLSPTTCICHWVARHVTRVALEKNCGHIVVKNPSGHEHRFDVVDLIRDTAKRAGVWPGPRRRLPRVPRSIATTAFDGLGARHGLRRQYVAGTAFPVTPAP